MTKPTTFPCPGCGQPTAVGTPRCASCGIRLVGELAVQLWQLDQQLAGLRAARDVLVARLRRDEDVLPPAGAGAAVPGSETRRALLVLGAVCLIAAITAGTALIWPILGVGGQTAVLVAVTVALLAGAVRLQDRLPATAEAIAAVAVAATAVDVVAGRRLVAPGLTGGAARSYWILGSLAALVVLAVAAAAARRLHSLSVGAVAAAFTLVVAVVAPVTLAEFAVTGLAGAALGIALVRFAARLPLSVLAVQLTAGAGAALFAVGCAAAAFADSRARGLALACGLLLAALVALLPDLLPRTPVHRRVTAAAGGALAGALLVAGEVVPLGEWALLTAGVAGVLTFVLVAPCSSRAQVTAVMFVGAAALLVEVCAQASLQLTAADPAGLSGAFGLAVAALGLAVAALLAYPTRSKPACAAAAAATAAAMLAVFEGVSVRADLTGGADVTAVVAAVVFCAAAALAATAARRPALLGVAVAAPAGIAIVLAVSGSLAARHVGTVEAYVVAPGVVLLAAGVIAMRRMPAVSSWALAPAIVVSLLPTLLLAWRGDTSRQVAMLLAGAGLVAVGAQLRLAAPLAAGSVAIVTVVLRVLGPQVADLPRWLTLGVLGAALLVLGSTWERRLRDARRAAERMRPTVAALR